MILTISVICIGISVIILSQRINKNLELIERILDLIEDQEK